MAQSLKMAKLWLWLGLGLEVIKIIIHENMKSATISLEILPQVIKMQK